MVDSFLACMTISWMDQPPFIPVSLDGICVWILHAAALIAYPKHADLTWLVAGPFVNATSGEMKDDMDDRIIGGFFTSKTRTVNVG